MSVVVCHEPERLRELLDGSRSAGRSVGLVPTMGALHAGHRSLIRRAAADCELVAVSIYVNPLQFAAGEDLARYPRDLDGDLAMAEEAGADLVFAPTVEAMFPQPARTVVSVPELSERLEGAFRPGHLDGVATIVCKLFALAGPVWAYFGEKDYQQLLVVQALAADLSLPVAVVGCPTVRTSEGLALSSRNAYLDPEELAVAPRLYWSLLAGKRAIEDEGLTDPAEVNARMAAALAEEPRFEIDYLEAVDARDLSRPEALEGEVRLVAAARLGKARLIDNLGARVPGLDAAQELAGGEG